MGDQDQTIHRNDVSDALAAVLPQDVPPWYTQGHMVKLLYCVGSLFLFSSANGYDGSLINGLLTLHQWGSFMDSPAGAWLGFIGAIYHIGMGINFFIAAWMANRFGRKGGVYVGYMFLALGSSLCAGNTVAFVLSRFFVGCASAYFALSVPLLINEIAYPTHRGIVNAMFMCGWYIGGTIGSFVVYGTRNMDSDWAWRIPTILQVLIPVVALPGFLLSPESPRWLISVGREEEARVILETWHAGGDTDSALVQFETVEITETIMSEKTAQASVGYRDMLKTKGNRHRLFISITLGIFSQWAGNGVVSYYLAIVLDTVGVHEVSDQILLSVGLNIWNLILAILAAFSVDRVGRRKLFLASATIMASAYIVVTALSGSFDSTRNLATGIAVIPFLFIFFAGYDIALTPLFSAYPCEIWPFALRSRGLTVTWISSIITAFFNTFVNPIALQSIGWRYYFCFVFVLVCFGVTAYFCYPETRGHTLEQMAVVFDGPDAEVPPSVETAAKAKMGTTVASVHLETI